jgi:hypothetical protein
MPIVSTDIKYRFSGGAANSDPNAALGGAKSSVDATASIYDNVSSAEALAGDIEYRCFYVHNAHGTLTAQATKIWIQTNTPSTDTAVDIGLGTSAVSGTEQTIANENTAPTSVTFSNPTNEAGALTIGDLAPGASKAVWVRRTVNAAAAAAADSFTIRTKCDTLP